MVSLNLERTFPILSFVIPPRDLTYSTNSYLTNENIKNAIGKKPYNVVAWRTRGRLSSDLVIGNEDASIIMSGVKLKTALKNCKVVFIID